MSMHCTPKPPEGAARWGTVSRTKQSAEAECNINNIMDRYNKHGQLTHISANLAQYRDVSGLPDMEQAMIIVADAQSMFMDLPAHIRKRVGHNVANFLPFIDDPENFDECVELGLLPPSKTAKIIEPNEPQGGESTSSDGAKAPLPDGSISGGD